MDSSCLYLLSTDRLVLVWSGWRRAEWGVRSGPRHNTTGPEFSRKATPPSPPSPGQGNLFLAPSYYTLLRYSGRGMGLGPHGPGTLITTGFHVSQVTGGFWFWQGYSLSLQRRPSGKQSLPVPWLGSRPQSLGKSSSRPVAWGRGHQFWYLCCDEYTICRDGIYQQLLLFERIFA